MGGGFDLDGGLYPAREALLIRGRWSGGARWEVDRLWNFVRGRVSEAINMLDMNDTYEFGLVAFLHNVRVSKAPFKLTPRVSIATVEGGAYTERLGGINSSQCDAQKEAITRDLTRTSKGALTCSLQLHANLAVRERENVMGHCCALPGFDCMTRGGASLYTPLTLRPPDYTAPEIGSLGPG